MAQYTVDHREIPDKTPIAIPIGYQAPEPLGDMIRRCIRAESYNAQREGKETFEESDDFETGEEEGMLTSAYQMSDMQEDFVHEQPEHPGKQPVESQRTKTAEELPQKDAVSKDDKDSEPVAQENQKTVKT